MMDILQNYLDNFLSDPAAPRLLLGILLAGFCCSILSPFVIVKRMTLASMGIGSAGMAGALIGMLSFPMMTPADWRVQAAGAGGAFFFALLILLFNRNTVIPKESFLGVLIVVAAGLSLFASLEWGLQIPDLTGYLYATPHVTSLFDLYILGGFAGFSVCTIFLYHRPLTAICIDREYARIIGVSTWFYEFLFVVLLTVTILLSIYATGLLLTLTLLILPGLCARLVTLRLGRMVLIAIVSGLLSCLVCVILSQWMTDLPVSLVLALIQVVIFILFFIVYRIHAQWTYRVQ